MSMVVYNPSASGILNCVNPDFREYIDPSYCQAFRSTKISLNNVFTIAKQFLNSADSSFIEYTGKSFKPVLATIGGVAALIKIPAFVKFLFQHPIAPVLTLGLGMAYSTAANAFGNQCKDLDRYIESEIFLIRYKLLLEMTDEHFIEFVAFGCFHGHGLERLGKEGMQLVRYIMHNLDIPKHAVKLLDKQQDGQIDDAKQAVLFHLDGFLSYLIAARLRGKQQEVQNYITNNILPRLAHFANTDRFRKEDCLYRVASFLPLVNSIPQEVVERLKNKLGMI